MALVILAAVVLAVLVLTGRNPEFMRHGLKMGWAVAAVAAAALAVVTGLRGGWIISLGLAVLAAYLGAQVRPAKKKQPVSGGMDPAQARAILGIGPEAGVEEIEAAHRHLIRRAHPDQGGSSGLAAQVNAARDCLRRLA